jgi:AmmeMemoRadiSam system protein A
MVGMMRSVFKVAVALLVLVLAIVWAEIVLSAAPETPPAEGGRPVELTFSEMSRQELLSMARVAAKSAVEGSRVSYDPSNNAELQVKAGCFVTLKNKGNLRGCIGRFTSDAPLWKTVREMAVSSATMDYRFSSNPITVNELPELEIEISVLSPLSMTSRPLEDIKLGKHGILIKDKGRTGTFLPQVATETGWSLEEFLGHCSADKAGLGWEGWKAPTAAIYTYTATIIDEKELKVPRGK